MLTPQQTQERSLSVIRNNQTCKASPMEILFPQAHRNIQMRKILDSLPLSLRNSTPPPPEDFSDATGFKRGESGKPYPFRLPVDAFSIDPKVIMARVTNAIKNNPEGVLKTLGNTRPVPKGKQDQR